MTRWETAQIAEIEWPKKVLGGLTPVEYALRLADQEVITIPGKL